MHEWQSCQIMSHFWAYFPIHTCTVCLANCHGTMLDTSLQLDNSNPISFLHSLRGCFLGTAMAMTSIETSLLECFAHTISPFRKLHWLINGHTQFWYQKVYGSIFYVGMGQVQNGCLYFKVWEQLCDNHSKVWQNTFAIATLPQEFCYPILKLRTINMKILILVSFFLSSSCVTQKL